MRFKRKLSWKPRRRGEKYCAPACGRGCLKSEHDEALANAKRLAKLLGPGWKPTVWENLGWYYCAKFGGTKVHGGRGFKGFTAYIGDRDSPGGTWYAHGDSPREALEGAISAALIDIEERNTRLADAQAGFACGRRRAA